MSKEITTMNFEFIREKKNEKTKIEQYFFLINNNKHKC